MYALRLPTIFENLGQSNVIPIVGFGAFGHKGGPERSAVSCRQGEAACITWESGAYGDISLSGGVVGLAKIQEEVTGALLVLQKDAGRIYLDWKDKLGFTDGSSAQAVTFDRQEKGSRGRHCWRRADFVTRVAAASYSS